MDSVRTDDKFIFQLELMNHNTRNPILSREYTVYKIRFIITNTFLRPLQKITSVTV